MRRFWPFFVTILEARTVPIKLPVYRFVLEKRLPYRITTENGKFLITQCEPHRHYKQTVFRYKVFRVNRTVPKSRKRWKTVWFFETVRSALQLKRKTVLIFWTVRFALFNESFALLNGQFFSTVRSAVILKKRITESLKMVRIALF